MKNFISVKKEEKTFATLSREEKQQHNENVKTNFPFTHRLTEVRFHHEKKPFFTADFLLRSCESDRRERGKLEIVSRENVNREDSPRFL